MRYIYLAGSLIVGCLFLGLTVFHLGAQNSTLLQHSGYGKLFDNFRPSNGLDSDSYNNGTPDSKHSTQNSTLGFGSIQAIVLPHRDDQKDILALLASTYDLDIDIVPGVYPDDVKIAPVGAVHAGNEGPFPWQIGEVACWRAHANIWREMLLTGRQTTLIIEGDADFQMNIRDELAQLPSVIRQLQQQLLVANQRAPYDDDDPYHSESWDILQLGWCMEWARTVVNGSVVYQSPTAYPGDLMNPSYFTYLAYEAEGLDIKVLTEEKRKLLHVSLTSECTTAYAVSRRGAQRLLHKQTRSWMGPVDNAISDLSHSMEIVALSVIPPLFFQRKYMDHVAPSSDIHTRKIKRDSILDFNRTLDDNVGFDGEDLLWKLPEDRSDRSASMAMSGLIWPEKSSKGPDPELAWIPKARQELEGARAAEAASQASESR